MINEHIIIFILVIILLIFSISMIKIIEFCVAKYNPKINPQVDSRYELVIVAIFKNEEDYLEEWLQHYIEQGVSHFYLYSNDPDMEKYTYLDKYKNYITMNEWIKDKINTPVSTIQMQAYDHCIKNYNNEYKYIMVLDIDEFMIYHDPNNINNQKYTILQTLQNLTPNFKAVKVERYDYGSDGHIIKPPGKVVDNYFSHEKMCSSYKTIANSEYIDTNTIFYDVHDFPYNNYGGRIYNKHMSYIYTNHPSTCYMFPNIKSEVNLRINHYFTKSYDEYMKRCEMWKNAGVHNRGYRRKCKETFVEKNKRMSVLHDKKLK